MVYRITYQLASPIITSTPIHLDALLAAVHPAMHNLPQLTKWSTAELARRAPLPLDSARILDTWVWCCTSADYSSDAQMYQDKYSKRKTGTDYYYLNARQTPRTGTGRDHCDTIYGVVCSSVSFWASSQDYKELTRICRRVKWIGGLRKMGYGEISGMELEETSLAWQECLIRDGRAMRNLPAEMVLNHCSDRVVVKPPYWLQARLRAGVLAGEPAELDREVWLNVNQPAASKSSGSM